MKNKFSNFFLLSWKKIWIIVIIGFISIILHNLIYALFNFEEILFLVIIIFVLPLYLIISIIYTFIKKVNL